MNRTFRNRDGESIAATELGQTRGQTVVLLHGGGQTRHSWQASAARLAAAGYRCISLDLRGHGDSFWPKEPIYGLDANSADLVDVLAALSDPPVLVGASLGGLTSLLVTADSDHIRGLVLVDVVPRIEQSGASEIHNFMAARPDGFTTLDDAVESVSAYLPHRKRPLNAAGLRKNLRERNGRLHWHWDPRMIHSRPRQDLGLLHTRLVDAARCIRCPTLLIRGGRSRVVSLEGVRELRDLIPHAEFVNIEQADHMVAGDDNDAFSAPLMRFLDKLPGA